jgi:hypothetical protein
MYKEIQSGAVESLMRKGFLICEEMRKYFHIYEENPILIISSPCILLSASSHTSLSPQMC